GELDAAALAAAAGVDLGLDHPDLAAQFISRLDGFLDGKTRHAARRGDAVLAQHFLGLILVNLHGTPFFRLGTGPPHRQPVAISWSRTFSAAKHKILTCRGSMF